MYPHEESLVQGSVKFSVASTEHRTKWASRAVCWSVIIAHPDGRRGSPKQNGSLDQFWPALPLVNGDNVQESVEHVLVRDVLIGVRR